MGAKATISPSSPIDPGAGTPAQTTNTARSDSYRFGRASNSSSHEPLRPGSPTSGPTTSTSRVSGPTIPASARTTTAKALDIKHLDTRRLEPRGRALSGEPLERGDTLLWVRGKLLRHRHVLHPFVIKGPHTPTHES